ncbi:MAG: hypothetical protein HRT88_24195, partial [Lentisphaeraceae bacterium]|nr:hypothetical protein [Lentisphaeraceae bacterium]
LSTAKELIAASDTFSLQIGTFLPLDYTKMAGTPVGSIPAEAASTGFEKAFDNDTNTSVESLLLQGQTGIDLGQGTSEVLQKLRFYPRINKTARMVGNKFQASSDGVDWTDLYTVTEQPTAGWQEVDLSNNGDSYRFFRYNATTGYTNVAEIEFCSLVQPKLRVVTRALEQSFVVNQPDQVISSDKLKLENDVLYHRFITFTLTALPEAGVLQLAGTALVLGDTFTQADIDAGLLSFSTALLHDNMSFSFIAADSTGGILEEQVFSLVIDTDGDAIDDSSEITNGTAWDNADTDGDGFDDYQETFFGTNATVNELADELVSFQGVNGLSASYWFDSAYSLNSYSFERGANVVSQVDNIDFAWSSNANAAGSSKKTNVTASFDGYIYIPSDGDYTFELISDDGSMLYIDEQLIVNNDGAHAAKLISATISLTTGFKKINLQYSQLGGYHVCQLLWQSSVIPQQIIPANYFYLSQPEHEVSVASADYDSDGLTNALETQLGSDLNNADT